MLGPGNDVWMRYLAGRWLIWSNGKNEQKEEAGEENAVGGRERIECW